MARITREIKPATTRVALTIKKWVYPILVIGEFLSGVSFLVQVGGFSFTVPLGGSWWRDIFGWFAFRFGISISEA